MSHSDLNQGVASEPQEDKLADGCVKTKPIAKRRAIKKTKKTLDKKSNQKMRPICRDRKGRFACLCGCPKGMSGRVRIGKRGKSKSAQSSRSAGSHCSCPKNKTRKVKQGRIKKRS